MPLWMAIYNMCVKIACGTEMIFVEDNKFIN